MLALLLFLLLLAPAWAVEGASAPLKAGVSLSDRLPSVPSELAPGAQFEPGTMDKYYKSLEDWRRIPVWKVGSFHIETEIRFTPNGPREELARLDTAGGHVQDAKGHYWHRYNVPEAAAPVESENSVQYSTIVSDEPIEIGPQKCVSRIRGMSVIVDKRTGRIKTVAQQECLQVETPVGPGRYRTDTERRIYEPDGRYVADIVSTTFADRTAPFEPLPQLNKSFENYLMSHGRADLLPGY